MQTGKVRGRGGGELPYKSDVANRWQFWKEPLKGTIVFCRRLMANKVIQLGSKSTRSSRKYFDYSGTRNDDLQIRSSFSYRLRYETRREQVWPRVIVPFISTVPRITTYITYDLSLCRISSLSRKGKVAKGRWFHPSQEKFSLPCVIPISFLGITLRRKFLGYLRQIKFLLSR